MPVPIVPLKLFLSLYRVCVCFQLSLVDLAGSERASKTGATPEQLKVSLILFYFTVQWQKPMQRRARE